MNNPAPQIIGLPEPQATLAAADPPPRSRSGHTRNGKIARLPKTVRDQLDQMLEDGATVDQIKDTLGDPVRDISPNCFSEWKKGGHLDWRKDQFWRQEMRLRQEAFTDILEGADPVNPYAMAVYGGDVGLDEFAKHPNAELLWQTAQARVTWNCDLALWSSHDGMDTLFNTFAQQARLLASGPSSSSSSFSSSSSPAPSLNGAPSADSRSDAPRSDALTLSPSDAPRPSGPWNLYFRVTMPDAVEGGLLDVINRTTDANFTPAQFLADCRARAGSEEIFQQSYMCNPMGAASSHIVEASALEHCRADYQIIRAHFEQDQIHQQFGAFRPDTQAEREYEIGEFINKKFLPLFQGKQTYRLGFDVAASGQGSLAAIYIDEVKGSELWLRALFTCRTEDWNFLYTVLATFLRSLKYVRAAGDQTGLGRQICWDAAKRFPGRFTSVNFSSKKHDIGFALMNQLATAQKRFPRSEQDIGADYFALRKIHEAGRWVFTESPNALNPASHCDIAWAGGLATEAHTANQCWVGALVG